MKCAKTRAYCLPIAERPSGSCAVLTGSLAEKESLLCHCDKISVQRKKKKRKRSVYLRLSELILDEGKKQEVWKENWAPDSDAGRNLTWFTSGYI